MVTTDVLRSVPLFSAMQHEQLSALANCATLRRYPRSTLILRAGEETDGLYVMLSGRAKVLIPDDEGHEVDHHRTNPERPRRPPPLAERPDGSERGHEEREQAAPPRARPEHEPEPERDVHRDERREREDQHGDDHHVLHSRQA